MRLTLTLAEYRVAEALKRQRKTDDTQLKTLGIFDLKFSCGDLRSPHCSICCFFFFWKVAHSWAITQKKGEGSSKLLIGPRWLFLFKMKPFILQQLPNA